MYALLSAPLAVLLAITTGYQWLYGIPVCILALELGARAWRGR